MAWEHYQFVKIVMIYCNLIPVATVIPAEAGIQKH
jgi:hypothetical protein